MSIFPYVGWGTTAESLLLIGGQVCPMVKFNVNPESIYDIGRISEFDKVSFCYF